MQASKQPRLTRPLGKTIRTLFGQSYTLVAPPPLLSATFSDTTGADSQTMSVYGRQDTCLAISTTTMRGLNSPTSALSSRANRQREHPGRQKDIIVSKRQGQSLDGRSNRSSSSKSTTSRRHPIPVSRWAWLSRRTSKRTVGASGFRPTKTGMKRSLQKITPQTRTRVVVETKTLEQH